MAQNIARRRCVRGGGLTGQRASSRWMELWSCRSRIGTNCAVGGRRGGGRTAEQIFQSFASAGPAGTVWCFACQGRAKQALGFALSAMRLRCLIRDSHHGGPARARATENGAGPSVRRCRSSASASATARGPWSTSRKGEGDEGPPRRPFSPACHGGEPPRHLSLTSMHVPRVIAVARSRI
jgi:hypothetical protein